MTNLAGDDGQCHTPSIFRKFTRRENMTQSFVVPRIACLALVALVPPSAPNLFAANPAIAANGVKNAASYANPALPNGAIAQGSIFNVFGANMGPTSLAYASTLPLPTTLSGT